MHVIKVELFQKSVDNRGENLSKRRRGDHMTELVVSGFFLAVSLIYLFLVRDMPFGTLTSPKTGFMPIIAGVGALVLSSINLYKVIRARRIGNEYSLDRAGLLRLSIFGVVLIGYLASLKTIGFFPATFLVLFLLIQLATGQWRMPLIVSFSVTAAFYLVFFRLLGIQFP
jgi:putative tricarboxylic transport membrane protein